MTKRRFTILDGMILVASLGLSFAILRHYDPGDLSYPNAGPRSAANVLRERWFRLVGYAFPLVLGPTFGTLIVLVRKPPLRRLRLILQPGTAACLAASVAVALTMLNSIGQRALYTLISPGSGFHLPSPPFASIVSDGAGGASVSLPEFWSEFLSGAGFPTDEPAFAIMIVWSLLLAVGRWRLSSHWTDRLGFSLGVVWVAAYLLQSLLSTLQFLLL